MYNHEIDILFLSTRTCSLTCWWKVYSRFDVKYIFISFMYIKKYIVVKNLMKYTTMKCTKLKFTNTFFVFFSTRNCCCYLKSNRTSFWTKLRWKIQMQLTFFPRFFLLETLNNCRPSFQYIYIYIYITFN